MSSTDPPTAVVGAFISGIAVGAVIEHRLELTGGRRPVTALEPFDRGHPEWKLTEHPLAIVFKDD